MRLLAAFALAAPLLATTALPVPAIAQSQAGLAQVSAHLKAVNTMVADFAQTDRRGRTLTGTVTLKRPGKVRFQYQKGVPLLVVADGKALTMIDYQVRQVSRWPIGNSPLGVLLDPNKDLSRVATIVQDDAQVLSVRARDPKRAEYGTITLAFSKSASAPGGLMLHGWTMIDAQNNRTTVRLTNQKFNVAVADSSFRWTDPRRGGPRG
jgi:outer membrane lipoprotein-sorting protein